MQTIYHALTQSFLRSLLSQNASLIPFTTLFPLPLKE